MRSGKISFKESFVMKMSFLTQHLVPEATTHASVEHARTIRKQYTHAMRSAKPSEGAHRQLFAQRPKLGTIEEAIEEKSTAKAAITLHAKCRRLKREFSHV